MFDEQKVKNDAIY